MSALAVPRPMPWRAPELVRSSGGLEVHLAGIHIADQVAILRFVGAELTELWRGNQADWKGAYAELFVSTVREFPDAFVSVQPWFCKVLAQTKFFDPAKAGVSTKHQLERSEAINDWAVATLATFPPVIVATDASRRMRKGAQVSWAAVTSDGAFDSGVFASSSTTSGEMHAIRQAVRLTRGRDAILLTDSLVCVNQLADPSGHRLTGWVSQEVGNRSVEVRWVRGHNGHAMNECADRLALATRRNVELGVSPRVGREVLKSIVAGCLPFVDIDLDSEASAVIARRE